MMRFFNFFSPIPSKGWGRILIILFFTITILLSLINAFLLIQEFIYRKKICISIGKNLAKNMFVTTREEIAETNVLISQIQHSDVPSNALLGSSHILNVTADIAQAFKVLHYNACSPNNFHEILDCMLFYHRKVPSRVILAIDPWCFYKKQVDFYNFNPYQYSGKIAQILLAIADIPEIIDLLARKINDASYLAGRIAKLDRIKLENLFIITKNLKPDRKIGWKTFAPDGRVDWNAKEHNLVKNFSMLYASQFAPFQYIDDKSIRILLERIKTLGITISAVYLTPFHPAFFDFIKSKNKLFLLINSEQSCRKICAEMNIRVIGSYDPKKAGNFTKADFHDRDHVKPHVHEKLLGPLVAEEKV